MTYSKEFYTKLWSGKYKTAYSPLYETYVGIVKVRPDVDGVPIIDARVAGYDRMVMFRVSELTNFVL